jgi:quercetin dioxygenase-like cupin family protein
MANNLQRPTTVTDIAIVRWRGAQHPTFQAITQRLQAEGLKPYTVSYGPSARDGVRSHGYGKVMYCVEGVVEITLPDLRQAVVLKPGDRIDLPRGLRHGLVVGAKGARIAEGVMRSPADQNRLTQETPTVRVDRK